MTPPGPAPGTLELPRTSGRNHRPAWLPEVEGSLEAFLPERRPPDFGLLSGGLSRPTALVRCRASVAAHVLP